MTHTTSASRLWRDAPPSDVALRDIAATWPLEALVAEAARLRDEGHGQLVSYSRKVFIPLTHLCRDVCTYCAFAHAPRKGTPAYLSATEVLAIANAGAAAGCKEALFTLGDKPERRYAAARHALETLGYESTIAYLAAMCRLVIDETGLLPHVNPGVLTATDVAALRRVSVSAGLMLESASARLSRPGGPHHGSPDKRPAVRLETIAEAGRQKVPFTTGILIGIGETRAERLESLLALRALHGDYGHIQELIIQNFRAKPATRMADAREPSLNDLLWTIALARIAFGPAMNIQAPPNLSPGVYPRLIAAGVNDWGGISPVTPDHVNPEAPWPEVEALARATANAGKTLVERLAIYPAYVRAVDRWTDSVLAGAVRRAADADGFARTEAWAPGLDVPPPAPVIATTQRDPRTADLLSKASDGSGLTENEIAALFRARGADAEAVCAAADELRRSMCGDTVTYVVTRNINYTNLCTYRCRFCAFSKGRIADTLRGAPYALDQDEVVRRAREAWSRGAVEVCMQGGIHPAYTGETYLAFCRAVKDAVPDIHIHAFSPLEVLQGAGTLGLSVATFLERLAIAGLGTLPGTAAEVLDDAVRAEICPDKLSAAQWLEVVETAHRLGFRTTATIMFGHTDGPDAWARHLLQIRALQARTGGFTEFVPLPFVHMEAPLHRRGRARRGPTFRESVLMHAVARLTLHPLIRNIQVSWVKMGAAGVRACLEAGVNDLGGTLMNESISRAAGTVHGQEMPPAAMEALITSVGRSPRQRTTLYQPVSAERRQASLAPAPLAPVVEPRAPAVLHRRRASAKPSSLRGSSGAASGACPP